MTTIVEPRVQLLAKTEFLGADVGIDFDVDTDDGGSAVAEFAGRACYQSWSKPNQRTATNAGYLHHIKESGHGSVLEHGTAAFYVTGVTRAFTHELIRHRHLSYSQLSQRFVNGSASPVILPPLLREAVEAGRHDLLVEFLDAVATTQEAYERIAEGLLEYLDEAGDLEGTARRKAAREAARGILPNAVETRIVVSGNYRAWRGYFEKRCSEHADAEIREVSIALLEHLQAIAPNVFGDFRITSTPDGRTIARTEFPAI